MIYTNKCRRKEDNNPFNSGLALDNEKLRKALDDSEAEAVKLKKSSRKTEICYWFILVMFIAQTYLINKGHENFEAMHEVAERYQDIVKSYRYMCN